MLHNVNAGGSAIFIHWNLVPDHETVSHKITYQGRDHFVTTKSGEGRLGDRKRPFRTRPGAEAFIGHATLEPLELLLVIFNVCEPEEGRFSIRNQTFTEGDTGKTSFFHSVFPHALESRNSILQGRIPPVMLRGLGT